MSRILLVEDDDILRFAIGKSLAVAGYEVAEAADFRGALEIVEDGRPLALMIADVMLPGVHGFALVRMAMLKRPGLKFIHLTGARDFPRDETNGPLLQKPVDMDELLKVVAAQLA